MNKMLTVFSPLLFSLSRQYNCPTSLDEKESSLEEITLHFVSSSLGCLGEENSYLKLVSIILKADEVVIQSHTLKVPFGGGIVS